MNLSELSNTEIIALYSDIISELKSRGIIRTKNLLGDLGEYLAIEYYKDNPNLPVLQAAPAGTRNIDAISRQGNRYSIKSTSGKVTSVFYGLNDPEEDDVELPKFEYVIVVIFNNEFKLEKILELSWPVFLRHKKWHKTMRGWNLSINKKLINDADILFTLE